LLIWFSLFFTSIPLLLFSPLLCQIKPTLQPHSYKMDWGKIKECIIILKYDRMEFTEWKPFKSNVFLSEFLLPRHIYCGSKFLKSIYVLCKSRDNNNKNTNKPKSHFWDKYPVKRFTSLSFAAVILKLYI